MATAQMVRDVMTAPPVEVGPNAYVTDVARRMRDEDIGAVVVTEEGHPRGLVTDRDLTVRILAEGGDISGVRVQDACSTDLVTLKPDDPVDRAAQLMREKAVRRLPVVDPDRDCVVGIVSLGDLAVERDTDSALSEISAARPNT
ncbi:CBS domain-containing protein [Streptomyces sp. NPDC048192]|uniref:CBS domain-containing protein n=1 Tax=unclassified Streptomyces TaxID=2593676 RepID=UPI0037135073